MSETGYLKYVRQIKEAREEQERQKEEERLWKNQVIADAKQGFHPEGI